MGELREKVAHQIAERAIGVTWDRLHADRSAARKAQRSGTDITDYGVHQDEILDAADTIIASIREALLSDEASEAAAHEHFKNFRWDSVGPTVHARWRAISRAAISAALDKIGAPHAR